MNNEVLARNVAHIRRGMCLGQNEFAKECGINPGNFSKAMSGKNPFSEQMLMNIAKVAGTSFEDLVSEDFVSKYKKDGGTAEQMEQSSATDATVSRVMQLEKENEMLKAQIEKQGEEILFYRRLLLERKEAK